jgi:hypothetical protein
MWIPTTRVAGNGAFVEQCLADPGYQITGWR